MAKQVTKRNKSSIKKPTVQNAEPLPVIVNSFSVRIDAEEFIYRTLYVHTNPLFTIPATTRFINSLTDGGIEKIPYFFRVGIETIPHTVFDNGLNELNKEEKEQKPNQKETGNRFKKAHIFLRKRLKQKFFDDGHGNVPYSVQRFDFNVDKNEDVKAIVVYLSRHKQTEQDSEDIKSYIERIQSKANSYDLNEYHRKQNVYFNQNMSFEADLSDKIFRTVLKMFFGEACFWDKKEIYGYSKEEGSNDDVLFEIGNSDYLGLFNVYHNLVVHKDKNTTEFLTGITPNIQGYNRVVSPSCKHVFQTMISFKAKSTTYAFKKPKDNAENPKKSLTQKEIDEFKNILIPLPYHFKSFLSFDDRDLKSAKTHGYDRESLIKKCLSPVKSSKKLYDGVSIGTILTHDRKAESNSEEHAFGIHKDTYLRSAMNPNMAMYFYAHEQIMIDGELSEKGLLCELFSNGDAGIELDMPKCQNYTKYKGATKSAADTKKSLPTILSIHVIYDEYCVNEIKNRGTNEQKALLDDVLSFIEQMPKETITKEFVINDMKDSNKIINNISELLFSASLKTGLPYESLNVTFEAIPENQSNDHIRTHLKKVKDNGCSVVYLNLSDMFLIKEKTGGYATLNNLFYDLLSDHTYEDTIIAKENADRKQRREEIKAKKEKDPNFKPPKENIDKVKTFKAAFDGLGLNDIEVFALYHLIIKGTNFNDNQSNINKGKERAEAFLECMDYHCRTKTVNKLVSYDNERNVKDMSKMVPVQATGVVINNENLLSGVEIEKKGDSFAEVVKKGDSKSTLTKLQKVIMESLIKGYAFEKESKKIFINEEVESVKYGYLRRVDVNKLINIFNRMLALRKRTIKADGCEPDFEGKHGEFYIPERIRDLMKVTDYKNLNCKSFLDKSGLKDNVMYIVSTLTASKKDVRDKELVLTLDDEYTEEIFFVSKEEKIWGNSSPVERALSEFNFNMNPKALDSKSKGYDSSFASIITVKTDEGNKDYLIRDLKSSIVLTGFSSVDFYKELQDALGNVHDIDSLIECGSVLDDIRERYKVLEEKKKKKDEDEDKKKEEVKKYSYFLTEGKDNKRLLSRSALTLGPMISANIYYSVRNFYGRNIFHLFAGKGQPNSTDINFVTDTSYIAFERPSNASTSTKWKPVSINADDEEDVAARVILDFFARNMNKGIVNQIASSKLSEQTLSKKIMRLLAGE